MCDFCHDPTQPTTGAILNGVFGQACRSCRSNHVRVASGAGAQYNRDRDREDNLRDLIQPYDYKGNPNKEFIRNYPEQAKDYFTQEQLENYG